MSDKSSDLKNKNAYQISFDELSESLSVDLKKGLSDKEAKSRLKKYGRNKLKE
ncbi:MAG: cation-transporting P-type ATPase, partial [Bacteroidales bacterium]